MDSARRRVLGNTWNTEKKLTDGDKITNIDRVRLSQQHRKCSKERDFWDFPRDTFSSSCLSELTNHWQESGYAFVKIKALTLQSWNEKLISST